MRQTVAIVGVLLATISSRADAQQSDCTPQQLQGHSGWLLNAAYVASTTVPAGEMWEVERAGVASNDATWVEVRLQVTEPVISQGGACCWAVPSAAPPQASSATPKLALPVPQRLWPGQQLTARTNAPLADLALLWSGIRYPVSCLARRLGLEPSVTAPPPPPAPDFSALVQSIGPAVTAFTQAATALQNVAASVPPPN